MHTDPQRFIPNPGAVPPQYQYHHPTPLAAAAATTAFLPPHPQMLPVGYGFTTAAAGAVTGPILSTPPYMPSNATPPHQWAYIPAPTVGAEGTPSTYSFAPNPTAVQTASITPPEPSGVFGAVSTPTPVISQQPASASPSLVDAGAAAAAAAAAEMFYLSHGFSRARASAAAKTTASQVLSPSLSPPLAVDPSVSAGAVNAGGHIVAPPVHPPPGFTSAPAAAAAAPPPPTTTTAGGAVAAGAAAANALLTNMPMLPSSSAPPVSAATPPMDHHTQHVHQHSLFFPNGGELSATPAQGAASIPLSSSSSHSLLAAAGGGSGGGGGAGGVTSGASGNGNPNTSSSAAVTSTSSLLPGCMGDESPFLWNALAGESDTNAFGSDQVDNLNQNLFPVSYESQLQFGFPFPA